MVAFFHTEERPLDTLRDKVKWRLHPGQGLTVQVRCLRSAAFLDAALILPPDASERQRQRHLGRALDTLREQGVHRIACPSDLEQAVLEAGMVTVGDSRLWPAVAGQAVLALLRIRAIDPASAWVCLHVKRVDRDVVRCAKQLAAQVRYLTAEAEIGGDYLADLLYEGYGIARQQSVPPEFTRLDIAFPRAENAEGALFLTGEGMGEQLTLLAPEWARPLKPESAGETLYTALLLESGLILPEEICARPSTKQALDTVE